MLVAPAVMLFAYPEFSTGFENGLSLACHGLDLPQVHDDLLRCMPYLLHCLILSLPCRLCLLLKTETELGWIQRVMLN